LFLLILAYVCTSVLYPVIIIITWYSDTRLKLYFFEETRGIKTSCSHPLHLTSGTEFTTDICLVRDKNDIYLSKVLMRMQRM
jgi:hypothetical protein